MSAISSLFSTTPLRNVQFPRKTKRRYSPVTLLAQLDKDSEQQTASSSQQLNLSVLRFTLGIPGLDESYLPRWIGYGFGSLLVLNHFYGSNSITPPQLASEALGLSLAAFSVAVPYFGKFLKGATQFEQATLPEGAEQIFVMSQNILGAQTEEFAWSTYILLRNTNTISVIIFIPDALCVRGYWNIPNEVSKDEILNWFKNQIEELGLSNLKDTLYLPQSSDSELWKMLPRGTRSLLVQPVYAVSDLVSTENLTKGFVLVASNMTYAYNEKDRAWIGAVANKF